ncbi:MAG: hypothetical protein ACKVP0_21240 [Pirellulaceae bacterium]
MADDVPNSAPSRTTSRRRWWQFSLLNLILVTVIVCVTAAYLRSRQEILEERQAMRVERAKYDARLGEIKKLQDRLGVLPVADKSKVHIKAHLQDKGDRFQWRWRIYLPQEAEKWIFVLSMGTVNKDGFDVLRLDHVSARSGGQVEVELSIERDLGGSTRNYIRVRGDDYSSWRRRELTEHDLQSLLRSIRTKGILQSGQQLQAERADQPVELLRVVSTDTPEVERGLLFFIESVPKRGKP